jgi:hypothetical protein
VKGEDSPGGTGEWCFTIANGQLTVLADSSSAHGLHGTGYTIVCPAVECVNLCKVTTKCFTNICMPRDVAVADFENVLFENNLEVTPEEMKDLFKQNIDNLSPLLQ